jgi:hypothetical protein
LINISAAVMGPMFLYLVLTRSGRGRIAQLVESKHSETISSWIVRWELWAFGLIAFVPSAIWYWHAYGVASSYYPYHFFGGGGFRVMDPVWYWKIAKETVQSSLTPLLSILALLGAFMVPKTKYRWAFHWLLLTMSLFVFFAGWGNRHQWYQLPLVPVAAALAGAACQWITIYWERQRLRIAIGSVAVAAAFLISSYRASLPFYQPISAALRNLGLELKEATTPQTLIVAADNGNPTIFYYAHRKGWHFIEEGLYQGPPLNSEQAIEDLQKLQGRGATHLVFTWHTHWWLEYYSQLKDYLGTNATLVEETPQFTIYKLEPALK